MKSPKRHLINFTLTYFKCPRNTGLCYYFSETLSKLMEQYALRWPYSRKQGNGRLQAYFIPASKDDDSCYGAIEAFDYGDRNKCLEKQPMRREFCNFMLREICREMKIKTVQLPE